LQIDPVVPMPPPNLPDRSTAPALPAPGGILGPPPTPAAPAIPAGEPNIFSRRSQDATKEPNVIPASGTVPSPAPVAPAAPQDPPAGGDFPPLPK
ncbi:MAG: hypothetical protein JWO68_4075, partial [Actinomycetia bacterium]|nr:hypothetical protein [Actinomycetes bacterium]